MLDYLGELGFGLAPLFILKERGFSFSGWREKVPAADENGASDGVRFVDTPPSPGGASRADLSRERER